MLQTLLFVTLLTQLPPASQDAALESDVRLQTLVSVRAKIVPLTALASTLQKQTGVPLSVPSSLAQRKVTAIVHDRRGAQVMRKLEEMMFLQWRREGKGYRLELQRDAQREESDLLALEAKMKSQAARLALERMIKTGGTPLAELQKEMGDLYGELGKLRGQTSEQAKKRTAEIAARLDELRMLSLRDFGAALGQARRGASNDLLNGGLFVATTGSKPGEPHLPDTVIPTWTTSLPALDPDGKPTLTSISPSGAVGVMRIDWDGGWLQARVLATGIGAVPSGVIYRDWPLSADRAVGEAVQSSALVKRLRNWSITDDLTLLARNITVGGSPAPSGYAQRAYSVADQLEYLADRADVPVMGDAFRLACSPETYLQATKVGDWLKELNVARDDYRFSPGYVRAHDGWVMFRHAAYWDALQSEPPHALFASMEAAEPDLDQYADFAAALTPKQAQSVRTNAGVLTRFSKLPLRHGMSLLRLFGSLTATQRQAAKGPSLCVDSMSKPQQDLYRKVIVDLLFNGSISERHFPWATDDAWPNGMALQVRYPARPSDVVMHSDKDVIVPYQPNDPAHPVAATFPEGAPVQFLFGSGDRDALSSGFRLAPRPKG